jgi:DNA-binding response OmpR family regulator
MHRFVALTKLRGENTSNKTIPCTCCSSKTVSKHRLARAVAPLSEPMVFSALEWHIHNLRRKLGNTCIRTVRGVGYCMVDE